MIQQDSCRTFYITRLVFHSPIGVHPHESGILYAAYGNFLENPLKDMQDVDADEKDIDMISLFIISSMIQRDCSIETNHGLTHLIPHLMMDGAGKDDMLKIMILMQIMGSGNNGEKLKKNYRFYM